MKKTAIPVSAMLDLAPALIPCSGLSGGSTLPRTLFNLRPVTALDGKEDAFVPVGDTVATPVLADMRPLGSISPENDGIKRTVFADGAVLRAALEDGSPNPGTGVRVGTFLRCGKPPGRSACYGSRRMPQAHSEAGT